MKTLTNHPAKAGLHHFTLFLAIITVFVLTSCGGGEKKKEPAVLKQSAPEATGGFSMNCMMLTRAQVQAWVDSGWTKPGSSGQIQDLILQFYSEDAAKIGSDLQLMGYPGASPNDVHKGGVVYLQQDPSCTAVSISGPITLGNNEVILDKLGIFNPDGTLKEFEFIRFTPEQAKEYMPYITFKIEMVNKGVAQSVDGGSYPCPPYCCPPVCN